jgi:hypothetical protein
LGVAVGSPGSFRIPVERAGVLKAEEFFERYYYARIPVLLEGFARPWPAINRWCPKYLALRFGDVLVEVAPRGSNGVRPEGGWPRMRLAELADRMEVETEASVYLMAQGHAFGIPALAELCEDVILDEQWFGRDVDVGTLALWLGPRDTVTPLHRDKTATILAQVLGSKRVTLIGPDHTDNLYAIGEGYSEVDPDLSDAWMRWPRFSEVEACSVTLQAGDALFLPPRWWHHVRSLSASASVSIGRFACDIPSS